MKGYTIGTGKWRKVAEYAAARMQEMTGVECSVWTPRKEWVHPSWAKCEIPIETDTLIFDADVWCMEEWCPRPVVEPWAVMEPANPAVDLECQLYRLNRLTYFNGGMMMLTAMESNLLPMAAKYHPRYGKWLEQTALNTVLAGRMTMIPLRFNHLLRANREPMDVASLRAHGAINLHFTGPDKTPDWLLTKYKELQ